MNTQTKTISQFIAESNIRVEKCEARDCNPNMLTWTDARHWLVTLNAEGNKLSIPFSQGLGHTELPNAEDVLDCLASDSSLIESCKDFQDWKDLLGNNKEAEKTYLICKKQAARLKVWLGVENYETLLYKVERL